MLNILVTGANGFIGKNLCAQLKANRNVSLLKHVRDDDKESLKNKLGVADVVYHLAAVNRPTFEAEFEIVNKGFTEQIVSILDEIQAKPKIVFTSSIQVSQDNLYGSSKLSAEEILSEFARRTGAHVFIYRLTNVFGKWCRPNYNSVIATYCYNIARNLDIQINNPNTQLNLVYIDDVVASLLTHLGLEEDAGLYFPEITTTYKVTLHDLVETLQTFRSMRQTLILPDFSNTLNKYLYTTYLSYLPSDNFSYKPVTKSDDRGSLVELLKSKSFGQIFISITHPGITRGNHYHHSKVEKFCVISGEGTIRFRLLESDEILSYVVFGNEIEIVDIPPGYTHNIENTGSTELVVLFWVNEIFDPIFPDTYFVEV